MRSRVLAVALTIYEVTFSQPGTYRYYCTVHTLAGMAGTITVR